MATELADGGTKIVLYLNNLKNIRPSLPLLPSANGIGFMSARTSRLTGNIIETLSYHTW